MRIGEFRTGFWGWWMGGEFERGEGSSRGGGLGGAWRGRALVYIRRRGLPATCAISKNNSGRRTLNAYPQDSRSRQIKFRPAPSVASRRFPSCFAPCCFLKHACCLGARVLPRLSVMRAFHPH